MFAMCSLLLGCLVGAIAVSTECVGTICANGDIEVQEEREGLTAMMQMLQTRRQIGTLDNVDKPKIEKAKKPTKAKDKILSALFNPKSPSKTLSALSKSTPKHKTQSKTSGTELQLKKKEEQSAPEVELVSKDHNGNMCMLCGQPPAERVDRKYNVIRKDCGSLSSKTGPNAETMSKPVAKLTQINEEGVVQNGFCQLNFAKSCVDAVANKDYLYWAKSINFKSTGGKETAAWDGRYCRLNGFLAPSLVALQHDFSATQAKANELCKTKYAKYNIDNITFNDMMSTARYDDKSAPSLEEAERLAAWNCAMGDLGCDMALCAYSFCEKGSGTGLYDECQSWHPIHGMQVQ